MFIYARSFDITLLKKNSICWVGMLWSMAAGWAGLRWDLAGHKMVKSSYTAYNQLRTN